MAAATADVVIVGGGVMGTSIALQLARRRAGRIVLLEKHHVASWATGRSSALLRRHYSIVLSSSSGARRSPALGFSGHGFKHSPVSGEMVAELVMDGAPTVIDASPRFVRVLRSAAGLEGTLW